MPGVGQVWLTQEELDALLRAASTTNTRVSDRLWANLGPKLKEARDALGCPVNKTTRLAGEPLRLSQAVPKAPRPLTTEENQRLEETPACLAGACDWPPAEPAHGGY